VFALEQDHDIRQRIIRWVCYAWSEGHLESF